MRSKTKPDRSLKSQRETSRKEPMRSAVLSACLLLEKPSMKIGPCPVGDGEPMLISSTRFEKCHGDKTCSNIFRPNGQQSPEVSNQKAINRKQIDIRRFGWLETRRRLFPFVETKQGCNFASQLNRLQISMRRHALRVDNGSL